MTIIDTLPIKTTKQVRDLVPGDVIIHSKNGQAMSDMVLDVNQMPSEFGIEYDSELFVEISLRRSKHVLGGYDFESECVTFSLDPNGSYTVFTEMAA